MLPNQGETINIAAAGGGEDLKLEMDHSVLSFSHKMKVLHIDLMIKRSTTEAEMACWNTDCKLYTNIMLEQANAPIHAQQCIY